MGKSHKKKKNGNNQVNEVVSNIPQHQPQNMGQFYNNYPYYPPAQSLEVDSWRSYRNDATNLQSLSGAMSNLSATADEFVPSTAYRQSAQPSFSPYQPLRVSSGWTERTNLGSFDSTNRTYSTAFAARYPTRSANVPSQDDPLPSIENIDNQNIHPFFQAVKQLQAKYQPPSTKPKKKDRINPKASIDYRSRTPAPTVSPPPPPQTTDEYLANASKLPVILSEPKKLLVVLDLNGTLLLRKKSSANPIMRPGVTPLLEYLFRNHAVMIYTSAMPESATRMINFFLHPVQRGQLVTVWARDKLDLNPSQFRNKVQVYKKLEKIWQDVDIQKTAGLGRKWDQSNTILIDDSKLKALAQPYNLLQIPEYTKADIPPVGKVQKQQHHADLNKIQVDITKGVELKLEELKYQDDVSRLIRMWRTGEREIPMIPGEKIVIEDSKGDELVQAQSPGAVDEEEEFTEGQSRATHLPTPQSMDDGDNEDGGVVTSIAANRSVSPIGEAVFRDLLSGTKN